MIKLLIPFFVLSTFCASAQVERIDENQNSQTTSRTSSLVKKKPKINAVGIDLAGLIFKHASFYYEREISDGFTAAVGATLVLNDYETSSFSSLFSEDEFGPYTTSGFGFSGTFKRNYGWSRFDELGWFGLKLEYLNVNYGPSEKIYYTNKRTISGTFLYGKRFILFDDFYLEPMFGFGLSHIAANNSEKYIELSALIQLNFGYIF